MSEVQAVAQPQAPVATFPPGQSSLYVGDLLPEVSEAMLFEIFNTLGPVASVRVCRDAISRRSLGYAYVNFQNHADADRAIETMNFELIQGKPCRIMWSQRDPTLRRAGRGNIFIKGLDKSIDNKALNDAFSIFGNILSVKVVVDPTGQSAGRGFVHFEKEEDAKEAIEKANQTMLKEKMITVEHFVSRKERLDDPNRAANQFRNLYVKNIGDKNENDLKNLFSQFGNITSTCLAKDNEGNSKKFGFVCFESAESAKNAVNELNGKEIDGLPLYVSRAMKKSERVRVLQRDRQANPRKYNGVNLYIKNLDEFFNDEDLRKFFEPYGKILSTKVMTDEKGTSRGFGFACLETQEDATRAITELNGRMGSGVNGEGTKPLYVAIAQPKEERRNFLSQQYRQRMFQRPGYMQQGMFGGPMMMFNPYGGQRPAQPFFNQRMPNQQFGGQRFPQQFNGGMRPVRPQGQARGPQGAQIPNQRPARYNNQARNLPMNMMMPAPQQLVANNNLTSQLANADPARQKQLLGDALYPVISQRFPDVAGKLTGMLLQMDNSEILHLLEDGAALNQELEKAHDVLRQHIEGGAPQ